MIVMLHLELPDDAEPHGLLLLHTTDPDGGGRRFCILSAACAGSPMEPGDVVRSVKQLLESGTTLAGETVDEMTGKGKEN